MKKFSVIEKKICDEWVVGDLVRISNYCADDDSHHSSYGFVVAGRCN